MIARLGNKMAGVLNIGPKNLKCNKDCLIRMFLLNKNGNYHHDFYSAILAALPPVHYIPELLH